MAPPSTQIVFLPLKYSVHPEDDTDENGKAFLKVLAGLKSKFGGMIWGRSVDRADIMGIGVELLSTTEFPLEVLRPFQLSEPRTLTVHVNPVDLVDNPVTEIAILPLREELTAEEKASITKDAAAFNDAILVAPAPRGYEGRMALTARHSWAEDAFTKHKNTLVMILGWREVQNHLNSMEEDAFANGLKPIFGFVTAELDVCHFHFKEVL